MEKGFHWLLLYHSEGISLAFFILHKRLLVQLLDYTFYRVEQSYLFELSYHQIFYLLLPMIYLLLLLYAVSFWLDDYYKTNPEKVGRKSLFMLLLCTFDISIIHNLYANAKRIYANALTNYMRTHIIRVSKGNNKGETNMMANIKLVKKNAKQWSVTNDGIEIGIADKPRRSFYTYHAIVTGGNIIKGDTQKELKENIATYLKSLSA